MKTVRIIWYFFIGALLLNLFGSCSTTDEPMPSTIPVEVPMETPDDFLLPDIDLANWKVTLPIGNPSEVEPPAILKYATNSALLKYMYNDSIEGALVFYTTPGSTTRNSKYSRTELREQMEPGSNNVNWTFAQGGKLTGRLKVTDVSKASDGKYHRIIVMQIHGRLTNEQRDLIKEDDNNAPPVLKIYWDNGRINVRRKILKQTDLTYEEKLGTDAWKDESHWFDIEVGFEEFELQIVAKDDVLSVSINNTEELNFSDIHVEEWAVFENYFKAGNYLQTTDDNSFSEVKYFDLEIEH